MGRQPSGDRPEHRVHPGRRPRLGRPQLLRRDGLHHAAPRPARRAGGALHAGYANSAVCSATRVALITGRYQYRLPVGLEEPLAGQAGSGLPPEHPTLPSLLREAGYATALIGKWHLGGLPKYGPLQSGYDEFWGFRSGGVDYFTHRTSAAERRPVGRRVPVEQTGY